jgi:hypothetical protein
MANNTTNTSSEVVREAAQNTDLMAQIPDPVVIAGGIGLTAGISILIWMYFNDKKYNYITRISAWLSGKIGAEENEKKFDKEEHEDLAEEVAEKDEVKADPDDLLEKMQAIAENMEYIGRSEERKKQREDENLKDLLTINVVMTGVLLLIKLYNMFVAG